MQRSWLLGLLGLVVLLGVGAVVAAVAVQGGRKGAVPTPALGRRPPGPSPNAAVPGRPAEGSQARQRAEGLIRALQQSGATEEDSEKVRSFIQIRQELLAELREALNALRTAAADEKATDQQVSEALATFRQKKDEVNAKIEAERKALAAALDLENRPRIAAGLLTVGVLDNGLPFGGRGRRGGGPRGEADEGAPQRPRAGETGRGARSS